MPSIICQRTTCKLFAIFDDNALNPEQGTNNHQSIPRSRWVGQWVALAMGSAKQERSVCLHKVVPTFQYSHASNATDSFGGSVPNFDGRSPTDRKYRPNIEKFTVRRQKNRQYIAVQGSPFTLLHQQEPDELPGKDPHARCVLVRTGRSSTTNGFHTLKQRQLSVHIANKTAISPMGYCFRCSFKVVALQ